MKKEIKRFFIVWRVRIGFLFGLVFFILAKPCSPVLVIIGVELIILGVGLRIWSSGFLKKADVLAVSGPYAYLRHPLYLGSFFIALGFLLIGTEYSFIKGKIFISLTSIIFWGLFFLIFFPIYYVKIEEEEDILQSNFSARFEEYCQKVPAFIPRLSPYNNDVISHFSWVQLQKNGELKTIFGIIIILIIMAVKYARYLKSV